MAIDFRLIEFNSRRNARGIEAARVEVIEDNEKYWLWMSKQDISKNINLHGQNPELLKAKAAYKGAGI